MLSYSSVYTVMHGPFLKLQGGLNAVEDVQAKHPVDIMMHR